MAPASNDSILTLLGTVYVSCFYYKYNDRGIAYIADEVCWYESYAMVQINYTALYIPSNPHILS